MSKNIISVSWSGKYPCLCSGEWSLSINEEDYSWAIPFRNSPASTKGHFGSWSFNDDWEEEWEGYEDGLPQKEWIKANHSWLVELPLHETEYTKVYKAFQEQDWRHGSCGGCI